MSEAPRKPLPDLTRNPDRMPTRKRLDPVKSAEFRRQGRLFFGAALFFGMAAIMPLGLATVNPDIGRNSGGLIALISVVSMLVSSGMLIFGIVRFCQAAGANQGCAVVMAIIVGGGLMLGMIYQVIWYFVLRKPGGPGL